MKRLFIGLILSVLVSIGVASAFQVSPTSFTIPSNVPSSFNITFYNNQNTTINVTLYTSHAKIIDAYFLSNLAMFPQTFTLSPFSSQIVRFAFNPVGTVSSLPIALNISYTENSQSGYIIFDTPIMPTQKIIYSVDHASSVYPYEPFKFNVSMMNIPGQAGSALPLIYTLYHDGNVISNVSSTVTLSTLGMNKFLVSMPLNKFLAPGNYTLYVTTNYAGQTSTSNTTLSVLAYYSLSTASYSKMGIFGGTKSETFTNNGNEPIQTSNLSLAIGSFNSIFISSRNASIGSPKIVDFALVTSTPSILPGQSLTLTYSVSYISIYFIAIIIAFIIGLFLYLNRKLVVSKEVVEHKVVGGFVDVKIALKIRNVSRKAITSLTVTDAIPPNALKVSSSGPKEGKIFKTSGNMLIKWSESDLQPGDEIMVMYEIKSKLGIIGSINLGPAEALFIFGGKKHKKKSNSLVLNIK